MDPRQDLFFSNQPASILIVDDTPYNLELLSRMLVGQGYEVRTAVNGEAAVADAKTCPPALILLDVRMPGMSGYEVCTSLKADERTSQIPIIFISATEDTADKIEAFSVGGVDYVNKPFQLVEVLARVETHLRLSSLQAQLQEQARLLTIQNFHLQKELSSLVGDRSLFEDLKLAIEQQAFQLYYQPIVNLTTGRVEGFESLLRWIHPNRGLISPLNFIPLAEITGLIDPLGKWVIAESCRQLRYWHQQFPNYTDLAISVNVSIKQLSQFDIVQHVYQCLQKNDLTPHFLRLEITESAVMSDMENPIQVLQKLKALGVKLYIDDFGVGHSSLRRLKDFPIDVLKVDQSFIRQEEWDIVYAIASLASALDLDLIAEGIETSNQLAVLKKLSCTQGQGYYFAKPLLSDAATALLAANILPVGYI